MAREIDLTKPLTDAELIYLSDRSRWRDLRTYAENMGLPEPVLPDAKRIRAQEPRVGVHATKLPPVLEQFREGDKESEGSEKSEEAPKNRDYSTMTVAQLKEELDRRRADYEKDGDTEAVADVSYTNEDRKDDLVTKLQLDDEESEAE